MKRRPAHVYEAMSKTLEIPDALYEELERRAEMEQFSVLDYTRVALLRGLETPMRPLDRDALDELFARLRAFPPMSFGGLSSAEIIREGRQERSDQIWDAIHPRP
jgi:hypothetical protein